MTIIYALLGVAAILFILGALIQVFVLNPALIKKAEEFDQRLKVLERKGDSR